MLTRFLSGTRYIRNAWHLCGTLGIRWMLFIPILLNGILGYLLLRYGLTGEVSRRIVDAIALRASPEATIAVTILARFVDVVVVIVTTYTAVRFGTVIASPLYGAIAERVCDAILPNQHLPTRSWLADIGAAIGYEAKKLVMNVACAAIAVMLPFIPVIGPVINVFWSITIALMFMCLDFTDASYSRRRQSLRQRGAELTQVLPEAVGFAVVALPFVSIPIVNLVTVPLCCAAGMFLATEAHRRASTHEA